MAGLLFTLVRHSRLEWYNKWYAHSAMYSQGE